MIYAEIFLLILSLLVVGVTAATAASAIWVDWQLTADLKGAIAGGIVAALIDKTHTWVHRFLNGCGAVMISYALTPGVADVVAYFGINSTDSLRRLIACTLALVGVILAEFTQRVARRILFRSDDIGDRIIDKVLPGGKDEDNR